MNRKKWMQFAGWFMFSVLLPCSVYGAAAFVDFLQNGGPSLWRLLETGEPILFIVMLSTVSMHDAFFGFLWLPSTRADRQFLPMVATGLLALSTVFYAVVYGWIVTVRLSVEGVSVAESRGLGEFTLVSLIGYVVLCSGHRLRLLKGDVI